jgi:hypothetical protein
MQWQAGKQCAVFNTKLACCCRQIIIAAILTTIVGSRLMKQIRQAAQNPVHATVSSVKSFVQNANLKVS